VHARQRELGAFLDLFNQHSDGMLFLWGKILRRDDRRASQVERSRELRTKYKDDQKWPKHHADDNMAAIMRPLFIACVFFGFVVSAVSGGDAVKGKELFRGCAGCHNYENDTRKSGPSLRTLFGKVTLVNGARATEENVRSLILEGFNRMPSYRYQFRPEEFEDLIAFLKTLNARPAIDGKATGQSAAGKDLFVAYCGRCHGAEQTGAKTGVSLRGLFQKEKLANGKPVTERYVRTLMEEGHADSTGTKNWLDEQAAKALIVYLKSL